MAKHARDRLTILYVEDSNADATWLSNKMEKAVGDYIDIIHCTSLATAHRSGEADIALLDLNLEDTIGVDTVRKFRAGIPHLPVVVLSQVDDPQIEAAVMALGAHAYFRKGTFDLRALVRSMEAAVIAWSRLGDRRDEVAVHERTITRLLEMIENVQSRLDALLDRPGGRA